MVATIDLTPPPNSDVDAPIQMVATASAGPVEVSNAPEAGTLYVDAVADAPTVDIVVTDSAADGNSSFANGEIGEVHVTATFGDAVDFSETHTITVQLENGFVATELLANGAGWVHDAVPYNYSYTYDAALGLVTFVVPDGNATPDIQFAVQAPASGTLPSELTFNATATATEVPTDGGCFDPGNLDDPSNNVATAVDFDRNSRNADPEWSDHHQHQ